MGLVLCTIHGLTHTHKQWGRPWHKTIFLILANWTRGVPRVVTLQGFFHNIFAGGGGLLWFGSMSELMPGWLIRENFSPRANRVPNEQNSSSSCRYCTTFLLTNASVKGNLELPLLKGRRRFDVETTSNLEVYIFRGWWILTWLIFSQCETLPYVNLGLVNLERTQFISWCLLMFC